ncbi:MAG: carboxypeptidase regulatory-like domain-containing protein [Acidobacteria bacterium]|nr:carboxypeptidase regulatory-like domain-containing protein [Acidobacteriota bacterium]
MENHVNVNVVNQIKTDKTPKEESTKRQRLRLAVAVLTAFAALCGLAKAFIHQQPIEKIPTNAESLSTQAQTSFAGRVSDRAGKAIPGAVVIATTDQNVGQTIKTDSNGQFQLLLAPTAQTLRLTVTADGFQAVTVQADVHRTGPEEIIMIPGAAIANPAKVEHTRLRGSAPKPVEVAPSSIPQPAAPLPAPIINQGVINNGTNNGVQNSCFYGGCDQHVNVDQSVRVNDPVIPQAYFDQEPFIDYEHPNNMNSNPGQGNQDSVQTLHIHVRGIFDNPVFEISCDSPCNIDRSFMGRRSGSNFIENNTGLYVHRATPDSMHHLIAFEDRLSPTAYFSLRVSSQNRQPVKITSVYSSRLPPGIVN